MKKLVNLYKKDEKLSKVPIERGIGGVGLGQTGVGAAIKSV